MIYSSNQDKYGMTEFGMMGMVVNSTVTSVPKDDEPIEWYALFPITRLTKANSFIMIDEQFYISKKDYKGKATKLYHVFRMSDKRYVCPSTLDKEETIKMVIRKYSELDLPCSQRSLFDD